MVFTTIVAGAFVHQLITGGPHIVDIFLFTKETVSTTTIHGNKTGSKRWRYVNVLYHINWAI